MRERSLVYIYTDHGTPYFVGCGVLVEGPLIATCRHVWRMATESKGVVIAGSVTIKFPHVTRDDVIVETAGRLEDLCEYGRKPWPDLALLSIDDVPIEIVPLQLAFDDGYEVGECLAVAGLTGRRPSDPHSVEDVTIEGKLTPTIRADDRRQFTGSNQAGFWLERGSSGSPVFVPPGQHVAGILSLSELGANSGTSHLHEAFVVRGKTIRNHVVRVVADRAAREGQIPVSRLSDVLDAIGARDVPVSEIPERIRQYVEASRAHATGIAPASNLGSDVDAAVDASRKLVGEFKPEQALTLLQERIAEETTAHAQRMIPLLKEEAAVRRIVFDSAGAMAALGEIARLDPTDVWSQIELGDLWLIAGNSDHAMRAYRSALESAKRNTDEHSLGACNDRIGEVLRAQGDGLGALEAYEVAIGIAESLVARDPDNTLWQRNLSVSHNKIGDVLTIQGDRPGALKAYKTAFAIREMLTERNPDNSEWQRDLSVSYNKIGGVLLAQGDVPGALNAFKADLAIAEALAARDLANTEWQRDHSVSHNRIGDVLLAQGEQTNALKAYEAAIAIAEALTTRDPANTEWQRDLSISHCNIGDVLQAQGDRSRALIAYKAAVTTFQALTARDPVNVGWQRDLSICHAKVGDVLLAQGDGPAALEAYRSELAIAEALVARDPYNTQWQRDLIVSYLRLSEAGPSEAKHHLAKAASVAHRLRNEERLVPDDHQIIEKIFALMDAAK